MLDLTFFFGYAQILLLRLPPLPRPLRHLFFMVIPPLLWVTLVFWWNLRRVINNFVVRASLAFAGKLWVLRPFLENNDVVLISFQSWILCSYSSFMVQLLSVKELQAFRCAWSANILRNDEELVILDWLYPNECVRCYDPKG